MYEFEQKREISKARRLLALITRQHVGLAFFLVVVCLVLAWISPRFASWGNAYLLIVENTELTLVAVGMTYVILTGGIDLSVGAMIALSGCAATVLLRQGTPLPAAVVAGVGAATLCGFVNGFFVARIRVPAIVVTLGTMIALRGVSLVITGGSSIQVVNDAYCVLGQWRLHVGALDVPIQLLYILVVVGAAVITLGRLVFGRSVYAVGANEAAAKLAGIPVARVKMLVYTISGFLSGWAGIVYTAHYRSAKADIAEGIELDTITAVVMGGTSIFGGEGGIGGTMLGVAMIAVLVSGLRLCNVPTPLRTVAIGAMLVAVIAQKEFFRRRRRTK